MKILMLTNEYPPNIYGGAGVHVENLVRELSNLRKGRHSLIVYCFGAQREHTANKTVRGIHHNARFTFRDPRHKKLMDTLFRNILIAGSAGEFDIVHCHTWYTHFAGCLLKRMYNKPLVLTTHSLEPQRIWKQEQMGTAYRASTWLEQTAFENADGVIAVSEFMKKTVHDLYHVPMNKIRVIHNAIDVNQYKPVFAPSLLEDYKIHADKPFILFVGRITRQKGIIHLVNAIQYLIPDIQVVLCASSPDTDALKREIADRIKEARTRTKNRIIWIDRSVPQEYLIPLYSHASVFVCPSIYEPFGLINLEAMACGTPVVSSKVGGIPEIVDHGETGLLIPFVRKDSRDFEPKNPGRFSRDLAEAINSLLVSPEKINMMGKQARRKVEECFSWKSVARQTFEFYSDLVRINSI
jgi:alpha-maltose-1-phosphate synthase